MKTTRILLFASLLLGTLPTMGAAATSISAGLHIGPSGHARVDVGVFYDDLASYGHWIERPRYGWVWTPRAVASSWRPYQQGHWVWTDLGWTWISDEPFGWATYHYGRWYDDPDYGWEWVPGEEWAPAWVDWQEGNDYVGWAPLPPSVDFRPGVDLSVSLAPEAFVFVPEARFLDGRVARYAVPRWDCERIYRGTRSFTRYQTFNNRIFDAGIPVDRIQRFTGRAVPRYQVADSGWNQRHQARLARNQVAMFRPQVERARVAAPPSRPITRRAVVAGAAAAAIVASHHAFRAEQAQRAPQAALRQQERMNRQAQGRLQQQARQQERSQRQQQASASRQAFVQRERQSSRQAQQTQQQARRQQQQERAQLQQQERSRRNEARVQQQARAAQQQERFQQRQQAQAQQRERFQQRQQAQAQQRERFEQRQQAQAQQQERRQQQQQNRAAQQQFRAQRQQAQRQQGQQQQQARAQRQQQQRGNPGQQSNNHHRRPPQQQ
ncbi:MAG TPA: DUF6600 domain-containing protein [Thermoanaerobaculia bacterium]|nr:DUF6600 domain-containing protein [Thermoanaerobaculia bacterium]